MSSLRQIEANRRNAHKSTGPISVEGKERSRCNAVRHGLMAETVIGGLEDVEDYRAFEAAVIADYDAESAVERELVLRLASLLWRLRRATKIETGLFERQFDQISDSVQSQGDPHRLYVALKRAGLVDVREHPADVVDNGRSADAATCFLDLAKHPAYPLDRLSRYEAILWRQAGQIIFTLDALRRRTPRVRGRQSLFRLPLR